MPLMMMSQRPSVREGMMLVQRVFTGQKSTPSSRAISRARSMSKPPNLTFCPPFRSSAGRSVCWRRPERVPTISNGR
ncbi:MAG: hypothetical protein P8Z76_15810 [Alphaproteobacteria bacterium]